MAMTRLPDPTPRMTLPRALLSEALRLARSPLTAVHLVCGLAAGLACGEYFSVTRWDPALGADAYAQFLGALMPLMSAIVCGLAVDEERAAGRLANLTAEQLVIAHAPPALAGTAAVPGLDQQAHAPLGSSSSAGTATAPAVKPALDLRPQPLWTSAATAPLASSAAIPPLWTGKKK